MDIVSSAIAGLALVLSAMAFHRTGYIKTLDLRIEVRKLHAELFHVLAALPEKLEFAKKSREHVNAARGMFHSGAMQAWHAAWEIDFAEAGRLKESIPREGETFLKMDQSALEAQLIAFSATQLAAIGLRQKYDASLLDDEKHRDAIRASMQRPAGA